MRGSCSPTARSGRSSSRARTCSPGYLVPGPDGPRPEPAAEGPRRVAGHRRPRLDRRRRLRPARGPGEGPHHPRRAQHRPDRRSRTRCSSTRPSPRPPPSGDRTRTPARCRSRTSRSPPAPPSPRTSCARGRRRTSAEPAAAPKRVDVVDAIPLTAVGKVFKPELRRLAAEAAARDALAGIATGVAARLAGGQVVVTVRGGDRAAVRDALAPFAFDWENADQETSR